MTIRRTTKAQRIRDKVEFKRAKENFPGMAEAIPEQKEKEKMLFRICSPLG